jgi:2',3'-cyclic-nucleotide 2'-phosphodiesterase/3'-nucleotidase
VTNAVTPEAPGGTPDYNYDVMGGLKNELAYDIDISKPVGSRISNLRYLDKPIDTAGEFVIAIDNYRQSGGGGFPHVTAAPVVYNRQVEIRQLLIDYVTAKGSIDPADFASKDWRLMSGATEVEVTTS